MYRHRMDGGFVVRRSASRSFNCVPTDQALEQTINREAKSQGGVIGFTLRTATLANDTSHHGRICGGFQRTL